MANAQDPKAAEKKQLKDDKRKLKKDRADSKREARKRAKEISKREADLAEDEEGGGFFTFLATLAIIVVWLGILCVIIKLDVGGFGSGFLYPILKDVPVINKILPDVDKNNHTGINGGAVETEGYSTVADAVEQIRLLEQELAAAQTAGKEKDEQIATLEAENARLQEFENAQVEFQRIKTQFFEDVVYAQNGPGPEEYRVYFEAMDPATAEYLYKQVVAQLEEDKEIQDYAAAYSAMKPKQAAAIFEAMTDNLELAARILNTMGPESRGAILGVMDAEVAAKLTKIMDPES